MRGKGADGSFDGTPVRLEPLTQGSVYFRHLWENDAQVGCFIGFADGHAVSDEISGDLPRTDETLVYGSEVFVPLGNRIALYGETNFIRPGRSGTVDAYIGFEIFPRGGARFGRRGKYAPVLPVASNTNFSIDVRR